MFPRSSLRSLVSQSVQAEKKMKSSLMRPRWKYNLRGSNSRHTLENGYGISFSSLALLELLMKSFSLIVQRMCQRDAYL